MRRPGRVAAVLAATAAMLAAAGPAAARPLVIDHFSEHIEEESQGFCDVLDVRSAFDLHGTLVVNEHGDGEPHFLENVRWKSVITNLDNGKTMTRYASFHNKDLRIVDNGDGTLTIVAQGTGARRVFGPDGRLWILDAAALTFELVVDTNGTQDPFDDERARRHLR